MLKTVKYYVKRRFPVNEKCCRSILTVCVSPPSCYFCHLFSATYFGAFVTLPSWTQMFTPPHSASPWLPANSPIVVWCVMQSVCRLMWQLASFWILQPPVKINKRDHTHCSCITLEKCDLLFSLPKARLKQYYIGLYGHVALYFYKKSGLRVSKMENIIDTYCSSLLVRFIKLTLY